MQKISINQRPNWQEKAKEYGFNFHTMYGQPYWCEDAYYQFSLNEVEAIEDATKELHEMCLQVVNKVVSSEQLLEKFCIPRHCWDLVKDSWAIQQPSLYSRLDLAFDGKSAPKLLENNADTPTSLFEAAFFQWIWLEDQINNGNLPQHADQFNSLQEKIIDRFTQLKNDYKTNKLYFSCCRDTDEDRGTVQYLQDCADEAGLFNEFIYIDDIGLGERGEFTDINDYIITYMFKLYPWEEMFRDIFSTKLADCGVRWLEPAWKSILSNKSLLPQLWEMYPNHPNLLAAYFMEEASSKPPLKEYVIKPIFSREGANIQIIKDGKELCSTSGPYGEEKQIIQAYQPLPKFENNYMLIGSWLIDNEPAGMGIREDTSIITQDLSRFYPHIILD